MCCNEASTKLPALRRHFPQVRFCCSPRETRGLCYRSKPTSCPMNLGAGISDNASIGFLAKIFSPETEGWTLLSRARLTLLRRLRRFSLALLRRPVRLSVDARAPLAAAFTPGAPHNALLPTKPRYHGATTVAGHTLLRDSALGLIGVLACHQSQQISGRASV